MFGILTDNQALRCFFTKPKRSGKESRWLETLGNFGIFTVTLKHGKINVLGDALPEAPYVLEITKENSVNSFEVPFLNTR